jgi:hypothetical protein
MYIISFLLIYIILYILYNIFIEQYHSINKKIIHVWRGEREDNTFYFMCKPIEISILNLLKYKNEMYNDIIIDYKFDYTNFDEINPNDTLIWIGDQKKPDFNLLKERNIYTIFYNIEPNINKYDSNEVWTYSKYLFNKYEKNDENQIIKFVPIICEENIPSVPYELTNTNMDLIFLGGFWARAEKHKKLLESPIMKENLKEVYNLWNDIDFNNYISKEPKIYLNLTKHMPDTEDYVLPSVRINKLLSHKCIIISEYTNLIDEEYYKGMIYFYNLEEIPTIYQELINKTNIELKEISNDIYKQFYNKFYYKNAVKLIEEK